MKLVLRDAFAAELPPEIVTRPKCVTRDNDRYRPIFHTMMGESALWPRKFRQLLKTSKK